MTPYEMTVSHIYCGKILNSAMQLMKNTRNLQRTQEIKIKRVICHIHSCTHIACNTGYTRQLCIVRE